MMKKITLTVAIACLGISSMVAQLKQRTILYEEFTGENCPPCASTNPYVDAAINPSFPAKILLVRFQGNIPSAPGAGSLYADDPTEVTTRQSYYSVPFAPYARFNGIVLADQSGGGSDGHAVFIDPTYYPNIINDSAIVNAPFDITVNHTFNAAADSIIITAVITAGVTYSSSTLKLQVCLNEAAIHFAVPSGTNGEKDFYHVMRKMIPNVNGTLLNSSWTSGATQTVTLKAKVPTYIHDKTQIEIVGYIQDDANKRVHNAGYSQPQSLTLDASITAIANPLVQCSTTITPTAVVSNPGTTVLTSCVVNYKIDAGAVNTYTWTGSLAVGTSTTVTVPSVTAAIGTHTLTVYTSLPNGTADLNPANDKKTSTLIIESTPSGSPVIEGFVGAAYPPVNWVVNNPDGGTYKWKRVTTVGGYGTSTNSTEYPFYYNAADGDRDELFLPNEDLTMITNPRLKFDYAYTYFSSISQGTLYDSLAVMLSTDCGGTWINLWQDGGATLSTNPGGTPVGSDSNDWKPTSAMWKTQSIDLSSYAANNAVLIKFIAINHYGNNLYLDNINLNNPAAGIADHGIITNVNVYPNPASTQVNVSVKLATSEKVTISLYNMMGELVLSQSNEMAAGENNVSFGTEKLASGIYSVLASSSNGTYTTKITISK